MLYVISISISEKAFSTFPIVDSITVTTIRKIVSDDVKMYIYA